ncbi:MAG: hypothetical protein ACLFS3_02200 [Candidatus Aenigmatarchaeota archaeon]
MPEEFKCDECGKTFDTKRGLHVHQSQVHKGKSKDKEEKKTEKKTEEKTEIKFDEVKLVKNPWKLATGLLAVLLAISLFFHVYSVPDLDGFGGTNQAAEEAGQEMADLMEEMYGAQGTPVEISVLNASDTGSGVYEINLELSAQDMTETQTSYLTTDEELFFQQGQEIDMSGSSAEEIGKGGAEIMTNMPSIQQANGSVRFNRTLESVSDLHHFELIVTADSEGETVEETLESYATKDGKYFFAQGMAVEEIKGQIEQMKQMQQMQGAQQTTQNTEPTTENTNNTE